MDNIKLWFIAHKVPKCSLSCAFNVTGSMWTLFWIQLLATAQFSVMRSSPVRNHWHANLSSSFFFSSVSHSQITRLYSRFTSLDKGENGTLRWVIQLYLHWHICIGGLLLQDVCLFFSLVNHWGCCNKFFHTYCLHESFNCWAEVL